MFSRSPTRALGGVLGGTRSSGRSSVDAGATVNVCDDDTAFQRIGGQTNATRYTYCIDTITVSGQGTYTVDLSCSTENRAGVGVGEFEVTVDVLVNGLNRQTHNVMDCGFGFLDSFDVGASPGDNLQVNISWDAFDGGSVTLNATFPEPFAPSDVVVPSGGCSMSPQTLRQGDLLELSADVENGNDVAVLADVEWRTTGGTQLIRQNQINVPANGTTTATQSTSWSFARDQIGTGSVDVVAEVVNAVEA